jgi:hypothetical protein
MVEATPTEGSRRLMNQPWRRGKRWTASRRRLQNVACLRISDTRGVRGCEIGESA